jgi:hypothetical protein
MIWRKLIAGLAVAAIVGAGAMGIAGASSSGRHHDAARLRRLEARIARVEAIATAGKLPASFRCAMAQKDLANIARAETWISVYVPMAQTRHAAALAAGETRRAHRIAHRIAEARRADAALGTVGSLITAACPA